MKVSSLPAILSHPTPKCGHFHIFLVFSLHHVEKAWFFLRLGLQRTLKRTHHGMPQDRDQKAQQVQQFFGEHLHRKTSKECVFTPTLSLKSHRWQAVKRLHHKALAIGTVPLAWAMSASGAPAQPSATLLGGITVVSERYGEASFRAFSMAFDAEFCALHVTLDLPLECTRNDTEPPLRDACVTKLKLDTHYYTLFGWVDFFPGGLLVANASGLSDCRLASGAPLPPTQLPTLVLGPYAIDVALNSFALRQTPEGALIEIDSLTGNVVCDGATTAPPSDEIFIDSFEARS